MYKRQDRTRFSLPNLEPNLQPNNKNQEKSPYLEPNLQPNIRNQEKSIPKKDELLRTMSKEIKIQQGNTHSFMEISEQAHITAIHTRLIKIHFKHKTLLTRQRARSEAGGA